MKAKTIRLEFLRRFGDVPVLDTFRRGNELLLRVDTAGWESRLASMGLERAEDQRGAGFGTFYTLKGLR